MNLPKKSPREEKTESHVSFDPVSYVNKKIRFVSNEKSITASVSHDTEKKIWKIRRILFEPSICKLTASPRVWQAMQDKGVSTKCSNCPYYRDLRVEMAVILWRAVSTKIERVFVTKFGTFGIIWYQNQLNTKIYLLQNGIMWYRKHNTPLQAVFTHAYYNVPFDTVPVSCYSFLEKLRALIAEELDFRDCKDLGLFVKSWDVSLRR